MFKSSGLLFLPLSTLMIGSTAQAAPLDLELDYWVVIAREDASAKTADLDKVDDRELRSALEALIEQHGPLQFDVLEHLSLLTKDGEGASAHGAQVRVQQVAKAMKDGVVLTVTVDPDGPGQIESRAVIPYGQAWLLGRSGHFNLALDKDRRIPQRIFYFVKAMPRPVSVDR